LEGALIHSCKYLPTAEHGGSRRSERPGAKREHRSCGIRRSVLYRLRDDIKACVADGRWRNIMTRTKCWFGCLVLAAALAVPIAALARAPASVSAICKDGTTFTGTSRRGACHGHGGVQSWETATAPTATAPTVTTAPAESVSATCRDGTLFTGATRRGACRGHGGVQTWTTVTAPATAPATAPTTTATAPSAPAAPARRTQNINNPMPGQVWVNTTSKVYHCPGDRYYGNTKHGEYLSETAAKAEGDRPSRGKSCS